MNHLKETVGADSECVAPCGITEDQIKKYINGVDKLMATHNQLVVMLLDINETLKNMPNSNTTKED